MNNKTQIITTKTIYPQIYAYTLPEYKPNDGWVKIGYTERFDVDTRIKEQTHTAAINFTYSILWSEPARFTNSSEWFNDKLFHTFLKKFKGKVPPNFHRPQTEWFYYNGTPEQAHNDFNEFRNKEASKVTNGIDYVLREEQATAVEKTLSFAIANPGGEFLWNAKPRFGKTLTTYDLIRKLQSKNVLIVTNRPAIANSWFDDFEKFIEWQTDYYFISTTDTLKERPVFTREQFLDILLSKSNEEKETIGQIAFISLQDLKGAISFGGTFNKLEWVKDLKWDLLIIDEAHEGVDTLKTDVAFNNIQCDFTLHLSGTPFKAFASGKFSNEQIFNWTYADEQEAKTMWSDVERNNPYEKLPCLNLFSYQMSQTITDEVNKGAAIDGKDIDFAFDLNEFFETNENGKFVHEGEVKKWLDTLSRNEKYPFSTKELRNELKHTFWLLNRVASAKALQKLLKEHPVFENYEIVLAAGDGKSLDDDQAINQKSLDLVREAIKTHEKTITLSVGQLTTGVTVPEWTGVLMLSNLKSPSLYMQAAFRSQNPWEYDSNGVIHQKQNAYVFDFAPERTLIIYDEFANNLSGKTVGGCGTSGDRENNIKKLLNFFPVIAEDIDGKMVELDVKQVLTIPKAIKAQEVVKRGFMSNFLFQNISGIFASTEAREILEQINPVDVGKISPRKTDENINTQRIEVDENGNVTVDYSIVVAETNARFGEKVYTNILKIAENAVNESSSSLANIVAAAFANNALGTLKDFAKENDITVSQAEQVVKQNANVIAREVEKIQKQAEIKQAEAKIEYDRQVATAQNNESAVAEAKAKFETAQKEITDNLKKEVFCTVDEKTRELTQKSTETILKKAEEKKKMTVEDDVRARLRGFARTIPSFLMAYGTPRTTLENFDITIKGEVFKEVTGITLENFRKLRDTYNFFDTVVFNESCLEFLHKKEKLANYFDESQTEDIFDYIPPQQTNQIYTPKMVVKLMIDKLEEENPSLFIDKDKTFADLYVKSGLYLTEIVKRLYVGLKPQIPNEKARLKHIFENQIYGFAPSEIIYNIAKNFIYGNFADTDTANLQHNDLTEIAKNGGNFKMKFDVVVGNPPYQESGEARDEPVYHYFYDLAEQASSRYCLISPARFLFNAGQTPKQWNAKMLNDKHLRVELYEQNSSKIFPDTDIKGGIVVIYRDTDQLFESIGVFTHFTELSSIVDKVSKIDSSDFSVIVQPQGIYRFSERFFAVFPQAETMQGKGTKNKIVSKSFSQMDFAFHEKKSTPDEICILGLVGSKREYKWISAKYLSIPDSFKKYRVFIPEANGSGEIGEVLSTPLVGAPFVGHTDTFLTIGEFDRNIDAQNCLQYIKTKFARVLLGVLKITQHNSRSTWSKVPLQDFTPQSDIDWTKSIPEIDCQLYRKYGLDEKEIAFIEEKIKAMN